MLRMTLTITLYVCIRCLHLHHFIIAGTLHLGQAVVNLHTRPGIGGGILHLRFSEGLGLPIGEALALRNLLSEEVGVNLLTAAVLDAESAYIVLQFYPVAFFGMHILAAAEHHEVILERETYLQDIAHQEILQ